MVGSPVNRFAWAFNDPAFSDVQLVLRAANTDADARGVFCASNIPCDCNRQTNASGYNQRDVSDHPARRACTKAFTPDAKKSEINKVPISGSATVTAPAALRGGKWIPLGQTNTEVRIYAHSIILASCSEMMRSWLSRWSEEHPDPDTDSLSDAQTSRHGAERRRRLVLRLDMELAPNELAAGEAVIRFMYTQALDGVEDDEELLACMLLADRWLLPDCVAACAARLQSTPAGSLSWRVRAALLALPLGLSAASPHVAQLQARAEASLMRTFRCPELILDDPDNRRLLLSLPPDRLEQLLLSRQDVQVTSENVVLALLSAWLQHNCHPIIQCNTNRTCSVGKYSSCDSGRCGSCCARGDPSNAAFSAASAAAANIATGQGRGLCGLSGDAATATRQRSCDCSECGNRRYGQEPRGDSGGGRRGAGGWDWGGGGLEGAVGAAGSPELEALLRLVRYRDLTPHYRSTVAPFLPGLRVLRLHHVLLAEASAAADAVTATGAADASSLPRREEPPSSVLRGVVPCGDAIIPDTSSDYESTPMTVVPATSQPLIQPPLPHNHYCHHHHQQQQVEVLAHPEPRPQHIGTTCKTSMSCTGSQESGDATAVAVAAAGRRDTGSTHSSFVKAAAAEASQVIGLCHNGSGSGGDGGTTSMEEHRSMMGNNNGRANSTSSLCTGPGTGVRTALETTALSNPQTATGLVSGAATAAAPLPFPSAMNSLPRDLVMTPDAAVHRSVPSLPRRLPYNMFRLIEWTRDIRDVRLHLTGVGGPLLGGEATSGQQLSLPVFLGGYCWHIATRFVPANAAVAAATAAASPPRFPGGTFAAAPSSGSSLFSSSGRLQLQLGVICTSPAGFWAESCGCGDSRVVPNGNTAGTTQQWLGTAAGGWGEGGEGSCKPLSIASCTVGLVDAAGRPAWQVVQTPCVLMPSVGAGAGGGMMRPTCGVYSGGGAVGSGDEVGRAAAFGSRCAAGHGVGGQWEFWSGLKGLEPTWWECGSALTGGGVLRLYCTLTLQA